VPKADNSEKTSEREASRERKRPEPPSEAQSLTLLARQKWIACAEQIIFAFSGCLPIISPHLREQGREANGIPWRDLGVFLFLHCGRLPALS
jgi:hypothetical protein